MRKVALLLFLVVAPLAAQYSPPGGAGGSGIAGAPSTWPAFTAVATSGAYADLSGKPAIPATTAQLTESGNLYFTPARALAAVTWGTLTGTPLTFAPTPHAASHAAGGGDPLALTKAQVGLGSVDNTPDASKPVSTAQQAALDLKVPLASANQPNGYLKLDGSGNAVVWTRVLAQGSDSYVDPLLAAKQPTLTLTTTGTSGAATLGGGALNIPQYAGGGSMVYPGAGVPNSTGAAWGTSYAVGTGAGNLILGNDARLSDARTPLSHVHLIADITSLQSALDAKAASNASTTVNGQVCVLAGACTVADATKAPLTGAGTSGSWTINAATASALASLPTACAAGNYPLGILANGNATGCAPAGGAAQASVLGGGGSTSIIKATECATGTVSLSGGTWTYPGGTVAAAAAVTQDIPIITGLNGNIRYTRALIAESTQVASATVTITKMSLGRTGSSTNDEMLPQTSFMVSSGNVWFAEDRPQTPIIGVANTYTISLGIRTTGGNVSALTAGAIYYEVCGHAIQ